MPHKHITHLLLTSFVFFACLVGLLFYEYRSLLYYRDRLQTLKKEYHANMHMIKQWIADYQHAKDRLQQLEQLLEHSQTGTGLLVRPLFDEGMKIFSSDMDDQESQDSFVILNRDLEYLKQQSQEYIKKQNMELLFLQVPDETWLEYTDVLLEAQKPKAKPAMVQKRVTSTSRRPIMRAASSRIRSARQADSFSWPVKRSSFWLSSLFGRRKKANGTWGFHSGIDMAALKGTPVHAAASGVVIEARNAQKGYGKTVVIRHNNKYKTRYAHLNAIHVQVGQKVRRGAHIGDVGDTGFVRSMGKDASHLHFELYVLGERVNPLYYLT